MMDLTIVEAFQSLGSGFFDVFFGAFYYLLNPLFTMAIPIVLFFAIDKRFAYKLGVYYGVSSFFCGTLKELVKRERPLSHPDRVTPRIENNASGYSMPSGHAVGAVGLFYPTAKRYGLKSPLGEADKNRLWVVLVSILVIILVGLSRVYMGGHYLSDVAVGWGLGLVIAVAIDFAMRKLKDKFYLFGMAILPLMLLLIILLPESDSCAVGFAFTAAIMIGGYLEQRFVKLDINVKLWKRILRCYIALCGAFIMLFIVSTIYEKALGFPVNSIKELYPATILDSGLSADKLDRATKSVGSVAYFLMFFMANAWAFIACPFLFKYVPRLFKAKTTFSQSTDTNEVNNETEN